MAKLKGEAMNTERLKAEIRQTIIDWLTDCDDEECRGLRAATLEYIAGLEAELAAARSKPEGCRCGDILATYLVNYGEEGRTEKNVVNKEMPIIRMTYDLLSHLQGKINRLDAALEKAKEQREVRYVCSVCYLASDGCSLITNCTLKIKDNADLEAILKPEGGA